MLKRNSLYVAGTPQCKDYYAALELKRVHGASNSEARDTFLVSLEERCLEASRLALEEKQLRVAEKRAELQKKKIDVPEISRHD